MEKSFKEITVDTIIYFDNTNIKEVLHCEYKESLVPHVSEEISIYDKACVPAINFTNKPAHYKITEVRREIFKNNIVIVRVSVKRI